MDLRVVEPECLRRRAPILHRLEGPQHPRAGSWPLGKGSRFSEYGVFNEATGKRIAGATEEEVYRAIGSAVYPAGAS